MKIDCPECHFSADVDAAKIPPKGAKAKCPRCATTFLPLLPESEEVTCPKCGAVQDEAPCCGLCGAALNNYWAERKGDSLLKNSALVADFVADKGTNLFRIVTNGEVASGCVLEEVRANIQSLCKFQNTATLENVFSGQDFVFKSNLDKENAKKYLSALSKTGIICRLDKSLALIPTSNSTDKEFISSSESSVTSQLQEGTSKQSVAKGNGPVSGLFRKYRLIIAIIIGLLVAVIFSIAYPWPVKRFSGVWSNQKGEFKTLTIALRKDGRGTFSTAIFSVPLRWEKTDDGIQIKASLDNNVSKLSLQYDPWKKTFSFKGDGADSAGVLKKVSNTEPQDIEAEIIRKAEKEEEDSKSKRRLEKTIFASRNDLIADLAKRIQTFEGPDFYYLYVQSQGKHGQFRISYANHNLSVSVLTLLKCVDKPSVALRPARNIQPPTDLPTKFQMPDAALIALENKLTEGKYKFAIESQGGRSLWAVESYRTELIALMDTNKEKMISLVEYLVNETFAEWSGPFEVTLPVKVVQN